MSLSNRWAGHTIVGTAAQLAGITLAAGQVAQESDTGLRKIGPGAYDSLPYMPRRWSAAATNLLATTNGDGVEKTVGSIVIPANTLAVDGDIVLLSFRGLHLNNTGASQSPQFGLQLNGAANWFIGAASTQTLVSIAVPRLVVASVRIRRVAATSINVEASLVNSATGVAMANFGAAYGTWDWPGSSPRTAFGFGVPFTCSNSNTVHLKAILAAHGTPSLHQITGIDGSGNLISG